MEDKSTDGNVQDKDRRQRTRRIGRQLKALYDEVAKEDVPDEFLQLLEQADKNASVKRGTEQQAQSMPDEKSEA